MKKVFECECPQCGCPITVFNQHEPRTKPVDLSQLIESGIDIEYKWDATDDWAISQSIDDSDLADTSIFVRPRMNHWHSWKGGKCPLPEGVLVEVRYRDESKKTVMTPTGRWDWASYPAPPKGDIIAFKVTGLADGYCWPWEVE